MATTVKIDGIKELNRTLRKLGEKDIPKQIRSVAKQAASVVADEARTATPVRSGKLRRSIRATAGAASASVKMGKESVPYAGWIDFGGTIRWKTRNRELTRPFLKDGRILYPALERKREQVRQKMKEGIDEVLRKAD